MDNPLRLREPLTQRKQVLKRRGLIYKYPRTISSLMIVTGLGIFFSKPIYDIFFAERIPIDCSEPTISRRLYREQEELRRQNRK